MDNTNELAVSTDIKALENSVEIIKGAPAVLIQHRTRAAKAVAVGQSILQQWENAYKEQDPEIRKQALAAADERSNKFLVNCTGTKKELEDIRKQFTQLFDTFKGFFTAEESKLDTKAGAVPKSVQEFRDKYAKWLIEEKRRIELEAQRKADKNKEVVDIKATLNNHISQWLLGILHEKKTKATNGFNAITLADYDKKAELLKGMKCEFPKDRAAKELILPDVFNRYNSFDEVHEIKMKVLAEYNFEAFYTEYERQVTALKQDLIDKLPSKKEELDEAERARLQRIKDEEERQREIKATKDKQEKERLQREAELKQQQALAEQKRLEDEKKLREEQDRLRLEKEKLEEEKKAQALVEQQKQSGHAEVLFNQVIDTAPIETPAMKTGYDIHVSSVIGWMELIQLWYEEEGKKTKPEEVEDLEKKTFKQIKTFAERLANKGGRKIESAFVTYRESHKAINKKEKQVKESA